LNRFKSFSFQLTSALLQNGVKPFLLSKATG